MVLQEESELLLTEIDRAGFVCGSAAKTSELKVLRPFSCEEVCLVVEREHASPVSLERLRHTGVVVIGPRLHNVVFPDVAHRVTECLSVNGRDDRKKADPSIGERPESDLREIRGLVLTRRVLLYVGSVEVIDQVGAEHSRVLTNVDFAVRSLQAVVRGCAVLRLEGSVVTLVMDQVASEGDAMGRRRLKIHPSKGYIAVTGTDQLGGGNQGWILGEDFGVEECLIERNGDVLVLLVVGTEEEQPISQDGSAHGSAILLFLLVGGRASVGEIGDQGLGLGEVEHPPSELIRAALRNHVHKTASGTSELDGRSIGDDGELFDRLLRERQGRTTFRSAGRSSEERIVVIHSVDHHAGVDSALAGNRQRSPLRLDSGLGRQQCELLEVTAPRGQALKLFGRDRRRRGRVRHFDHRRCRSDGDGFCHSGESQGEIDGRSRA